MGRLSDVGILKSREEFISIALEQRLGSVEVNIVDTEKRVQAKRTAEAKALGIGAC